MNRPPSIADYPVPTLPKCDLCADNLPEAWGLVKEFGAIPFGEGWLARCGEKSWESLQLREVTSVPGTEVGAYWIINGKRYDIDSDYHVLIYNERSKLPALRQSNRPDHVS